ncbi:rhodanese-related sulfurtransferase [Lusitaniella coriacea]|uniref:oxygen-dependent tRNA uridine(34) hydroxylase TrhO n=1 Tax=Lusitaniella coriacea TaxID=1983105 RepID=UPI003CF72BD9
MSQIVATFYEFVRLSDLGERQGVLLSYCRDRAIKGTILLATEGINGTIAGSRQGIDEVLAFLRSDPLFRDLEHKESSSERQPFERLKVRIKKEIVTLGKPEVDPSDRVGEYISPQEWNDLLHDPDTIAIDTRNNYEVEIGTFQGAQNPHTESFREFPDYVCNHLDPHKNPKVALFCTGGIRCEKATSYLLDRGFKEVYHLKGGILKYLEEIPPEESLWVGECFVFDERIAVKHGLETGSYDLCRGCGYPIAPADKQSPQYQEGICCPHCYDSITEAKRSRQQEKQKQLRLKQHE